MKKNILLLTFMLFQFALSVHAQIVSNNTELQTAIANATEGSIITLSNGIWTDTYININKIGTVVNPIVIKAATPGQVFFEGNSRVAMGGAYIVFEGVVFRNPSNLIDNGSTLEPVIEFRDSGNNPCNHCKVTNIKIDSYNGTAAQEFDTFKWILLYGQYNEISHSSFVGKHGVGSIINDNRNDSAENFTKIHHNYFGNRTYVGSYVDDYNDQDAIRIGNSSTSLSNSYTEVYDNLFDTFFGEIEIISNKSCFNKYYNNTFRNYSGSLTLRHGNNCEVYNNFFFANNNEFSGGIRVIGENHLIYNNYIEGVNSTKSAAAGGGTSGNLGGIAVLNGQANSALNGYFQVKNTIITNNTFVNCDYGVRIGRNGLSETPDNLTLSNNLFLNVDTKVIEFYATPTASTYQGNIKQNSANWPTDPSFSTVMNTTTSTGLLISGVDFYRIQSGSTAIDSGLGTFSFLTKDILGGNRATNFDAGAEEFGGNGIKLPYDVSDVGNTIGFLSTPSVLSLDDFISNTVVRVFPNPAKEVINIQSKEVINDIEVFDISGKSIFKMTANDFKVLINTASFSKGCYFIRVNSSIVRVLVE